ncbi:MAG TPA: hypothetical protein VII55_01170 [Candidatus Saccharimonadales bacterium]
MIGVTFGLIVNYRGSFKQVSVKLGANLRLSIYKDLGGDAPYNYNTHGSPLFDLSTNGTVKLKKGVYDFVVNDPSHQYENPITKVVVSDSTSSVTISPFFTDQKLRDLLGSERSTIQQTMLSQYPSLNSFYTIGTDQLYEYGNWYGAVLNPLDAQYDKLHIIMERQGGSWKVEAPPQISIGIPSNPFVPSDVVDSVDQL